MFVGFFFAFAVKAPMWPVHTWLPDAATEARPATAVLLVGVLDKVGTFGMIRFCLQLFPEASQWATPAVIVLAVISVLYGALLAIGQTDIMRLIAYTSVSHFGFIVLGIFAMTTVGGAGSTLYMLNHGFSTAALFLIGAMLIARRAASGSRTSAAGSGHPGPAGVFLVAGLSGLSLPGLSSFISEFLVLTGRSSATASRRRRDDGHHPRRALHPPDVQADDDGPEARARRAGPRLGPAREAGRRSSWPSSSSASTPSPLRTSTPPWPRR